MASALWTFETDTTTGLEADIDTISGLSMQALGDGSGTDSVPCPTVPGETGSGRLLASANHYNEFGTSKLTELAHTSGNAIEVSFIFRPLLDYGGPLVGNSMLAVSVIGYNLDGTLGLYTIEMFIASGASSGLYDFNFTLMGTISGVAMPLRDWNEIEFAYDGATTIELFVNGVSEGTVATGGVLATAARGKLYFSKDAGTVGAQIGVLDTVSLNIS